MKISEELMIGWITSFFGWLIGRAASRGVDRVVDTAFDRRAAAPRLRVQVEGEERTATNGVTDVRQFYARVKVSAEGAGQLRNCRGNVCKIERLSGGRPVGIVLEETFPLICSYDDFRESWELSQGLPRTFDVAMCGDGKGEISLRIRNSAGFFKPTILDERPLTYGEYRFTVVVTSEDGQSEERQLDLAFDQKWPPRLIPAGGTA